MDGVIHAVTAGSAVSPALRADGPGGRRPGLRLMHGLSLLTVAEKEWIGLAAYRLLGWTDRLFPDGDV